MSELRVLLWSPLADSVRSSGDTSYTEALLAQPPPGVVYTTYQQAIEDGTVRIRGRKPWNGGWNMVDLPVFAGRSFEMALRASQLAFREGVTYISIEEGAFDLVHQHLAAIRQVGPKCPVVSSAGYPLTELYRWRERWSEGHLRLALALEQVLAISANVHNPWLRPIDGGVMTVYSQHFRSWLLSRGVDSREIRVVGTALPDLHLPKKHSDGATLGMIAHDFFLKGGDIALRGLRELRKSFPWKLLVATDESHATEGLRSEPGVEVIAGASRSDVLFKILPRVDILLAPTRADCGAPYSVIEALQSSTPVVLSDLAWLDERLRQPAAWRIRPEPGEVATAVNAIRGFGLRRAQEAARELWRASFSMKPFHEVLGAAYEQALGGQQPLRRTPQEPTLVPKA